jgi:hypothetical protein
MPTPLFGGIECGMSICGELTADAGGTIYDLDWYTLFVGADPLTKTPSDSIDIRSAFNVCRWRRAAPPKPIRAQ